jgi:sugar phosphate isomerase/epimerase
VSPTNPHPPIDRRDFLKSLAAAGGAAVAAGCSGPLLASGGAASQAASGASLAGFRDRIGLQLFTVRDRFMTDLPGTLMAVARIGYKEVQTTLTYGTHTPQQVKAYLDRAGLVAPTTHVSPSMGPDLEQRLEGYRLIGHRYTTVRLGPLSGAGRTPPQTLEMVKRTAQQLNEAGAITKRHGIKIMVHNHTEEFAPLADRPGRPYDVLLAETDPALVTMELDIGWAAASGENALELFRRAPGRFEVWHLKDLTGLAASSALPTHAERQRAARIVPIGEGEMDYRPIFAQASLAGMKHFYIEQDTAPQSGDSIAAAATSYRNLAKLLS